jgi:Ni/Co efflux regulator RcnB
VFTLKKLLSLLFALLLVISFSAPISASTNHLEHQDCELDNHNHDVIHDDHAHQNDMHETKANKGKKDQGGDLDIGVLYVPCEVTGGKHQMKARGIGTHTLTNGTKWSGNLYQCSGCRMTLTTQYNYFNSGQKAYGPGKYILASAPVFVNPSGYVFSGTYTLSGPATSWVTGVFGSMAFSY